MAEIWGAAVAAVGAAYGAYSQNKAQKDAQKAGQEMSELGWQRQAWLDQQERKWALEDRRYVEDSIGGFRGFAPKGASTFNGQPVQAPTPTSTTGLADWNPNIKGGLVGQYPTKPLLGGG